MSTVAERLHAVHEQIQQACRHAGRTPSDVRLIAVSKRQPDALLMEAWSAGHMDFGENYVQEMVRKQELLPKARFHLIGHVQTNKAKKAAGAAWVHTVDSVKLAKALTKGHHPGSPPASVLVEVNIAGEEQKAGAAPEAVGELVATLAEMETLSVRGLMCIPPKDGGRRWFAALRELAENTRKQTGLTLPELSMGMSADFADAILEGSTMVRVGTAIFGPRSY